MRFSVIIPAYNAEKTIAKSIQSLKEQTFKDFEVIIVDDGSIDQTETVIRDTIKNDSRFSYERQKNGGPSVARNKGISKAVGEFLTFLDSDDKYATEYLETMNFAIQAYPESDNFWCGYRRISPDNKELGFRVWDDSQNMVSVLDRSQIMSEKLNIFVPPLWNKVFRREIVRAKSIELDKSLSLGEDLLFNYEYLDVARNTIIMINRQMYIYTETGEGSLNTKYRQDLKEILDKQDKTIWSYLQKWDSSDEQISAFFKARFWHYDQTLRNTYHTENKATKKEKRAFNKALMSEDDYDNSLKYAMKDINRLYRRAYQKKNWDMIRFLDVISRIF